MLDAYSGAWEDLFRGEIYEFANKLSLPASGYAKPGPFSVTETKYLIEPLRALRDPGVRIIIIIAAVQTGKSLLAELWVLFLIMHAPGGVLWLNQDDDFFEKFLSERFIPLFRSNEILKPWIEAAGRFGIKKSMLQFPHMVVTMGGLNTGNVQSFSKQNLIIDECWRAGNNGLIRQAKARTSAFEYNSKVLLISQPGVEGDDLDIEWRDSDQREWNWQCPKCLEYQPFDLSRKREDGSYGGLNWETNETTKPKGRWDYSKAGETAHLECFHCRHKVYDTPENRRLIDDTHKFIPKNPNADKSIVGFRWPIIANAERSLSKVAAEYIKAREYADEQGYRLPLDEFTQKKMARPVGLRSDDWEPIATESYDVSADWPDEKFRFLIADCQKELKKFYVGVYAVSLSGEARELARETCLSFDDIATVQKKWNVRDQRVFLDAGYSMTKVLRECVRRGHVGWVNKKKMWLCWTGLKGSGQETFTHYHPKTKLAENRIYSERKFYDVNEGTSGKDPRAPYYEWSNLHCKDLLRARRDSDLGVPKYLTLPDTLPADDEWAFNNQMRSERRVVEIKNGKKRAIWLPIKETLPNHEWDKGAMLMAVMAICGIIGGAQEEEASV